MIAILTLLIGLFVGFLIGIVYAPRSEAKARLGEAWQWHTKTHEPIILNPDQGMDTSDIEKSLGVE